MKHGALWPDYLHSRHTSINTNDAILSTKFIFPAQSNFHAILIHLLFQFYFQRNILLDTLFLATCVTASTTAVERKGDSIEPWCIPTLISSTSHHSESTVILFFAPSHSLITDLTKLLISFLCHPPTESLSSVLCQKLYSDLCQMKKNIQSLSFSTILLLPILKISTVSFVLYSVINLSCILLTVINIQCLCNTISTTCMPLFTKCLKVIIVINVCSTLF